MSIQIEFDPTKTDKASIEISAKIIVSYGRQNTILNQSITLLAFRGPALETETVIQMGMRSVWSLPAAQQEDDDPQYEIIVKNIDTIHDISIRVEVLQDVSNSFTVVGGEKYRLPPQCDGSSHIHFGPETKGRHNCVILIQAEHLGEKEADCSSWCMRDTTCN